jgi:hypothetical protein
VDADATLTLREGMRNARRQRPTAPWSGGDICVAVKRGAAWRVGENIELAPESGAPRCRRCGTMLAGPEGGVTIAQRPLRAAGPWMALRYGGDPPHFVLEEWACPSCATLLSVREVRRGN